MEKGVITHIGFYGDFLAVSPLDPLIQALEGCPFPAGRNVETVLDRFPLGELFGGITRQEVLDTLFYAGDLES